MSELPKKDVVNYQLKANDFWPGIEEGRAVERAARKARPRKPTLVSVSKDARKAGIDPARIEISPDGSYAVDTVKREPAEPQTSWPLDEFRSKETKQ